MNLLEETVPRTKAGECGFERRRFSLVSSQAKMSERERPGPANLRVARLEPRQAALVFGSVRVMPQGQQRPNRGNDSGNPAHTVDARIATVPTSSRTHTVVEHPLTQVNAT